MEEKEGAAAPAGNGAGTVTFREAVPEDIPLLLRLIKELAVYEKLLDRVTADEALLRKWLFEEPAARVLFPVADGKEVGYILYFWNFSTFAGKPGLYLEDLFILPEHRGKGYGKASLVRLAKIASAHGCARFEWQCLDWNTPSIGFYLSLGAKQLDDWTTYRLEGDTLSALAAM